MYDLIEVVELNDGAFFKINFRSRKFLATKEKMCVENIILLSSI